MVAHKDRRTSKVRQATQHDNIQIVSLCWLLDCFSKWQHVDEGPYLIEFGRDNGPHDSLPFDDDYEGGVILTPSEDGGEVTELPDDMDSAPLSPTFETKGMDWNDADDEVKDFLGSDGESEMEFDESDSDASDSSNASNHSNASGRSASRKRKRAPSSVDGRDNDEAQDASDPSAENAAGSALQKRRKKASERTTGLANVTLADKSSGLPSPETTGPDDEANGAADVEEIEDDGISGGAQNEEEDEEQEDEEGEQDEDDDGELEAALLEGLNSPDGDDEAQE